MNQDIYVHTPKTAGITLRGLLIDKYGPENVWNNDVVSGKLSNMQRQGFKADNSQRGGREKLGELVPTFLAQAAGALRDKIIGEQPEDALPKARVIIGHFAVSAFDGLPEAASADYYTIVREPLDRMASHYRYLNQLKKLMPKMRHWGANHDAARPFSDFAFDEQLQNYQTRFTGEELGRYALVGVYEDLPKFFVERGLLEPYTMPKCLNKTTNTDVLPELGDPGFVRDFQDFHAIDYKVYGQVSQ